mmetsp:Transcript_109164/g.319525  ORF Transcript_109164/g.319525 Transcript_109164/m.319525 type:complete len:336 (-) Transcript_109164:126-1133(-)
MGKSIRAKIKRRLRTAKRHRVEAMIVRPQTQEHHEALTRVIEGRSVTFTKPKNAFKYPSDATSVFPQHEIMKPIDFRSSHMPVAGYAFRGNRRKYDGEQADYMANLAKTSHPEMEVLAGGGAVLSQSGKRVSMREAEILATSATNPEAAAAAVATPASAASAVAAATEAGAGAGGDVEMAPASREASAAVAAADAAAGPAAAPAEEEEDEKEEEEPENEADHSRVPVLKDTRRAKRTADHRPRSNAVKKKTKVHVQAPQQAGSSGGGQASASAEPAGGKTKKKGKQAKGAADSAEAAAGPAVVAPGGVTGEKPVGKGKKTAKAGKSTEAADVDMA